MPWTELHGAAGDAVTQRRVAEDHPKSCRGTTHRTDCELMAGYTSDAETA